MNLNRIYSEFSKAEHDSYYISHVQREVLVVPVLVDIMLDSDVSNSHWAERLIEKICINNPVLVSPYLSFIVRTFEKDDKFLQWNIWKIIAAVLKYDTQNIWQTVKENYYKALMSQQIMEFSIACDCVPLVISAKPDEKGRIAEILNTTADREFLVAGEVSAGSSKIAAEKAAKALKLL